MPNNFPLVSIIIICEDWNSFLEESLPHYEKLDYPNYEIFVFSTEKIDKSYPNVQFINEPKLKNNPAERRDLAMEHAKGKILAFIDDDAFPHKDWLKKAVPLLKDDSVVAVGGPGVTPETAGILEHTSGWISSSPLGGFGATHRFIPQKKREIDDFPSMNLIVKAKNFREVGGFDSSYYPGEDTKLCLDLTKKQGSKILYDPGVLVYHHKRALFKKHLIQNGRYGLHRGHFARILPETSRRLFYFVPSIFAIGLISGVAITLLSFLYENLLLRDLTFLFLAGISLYIILLFLNSIWVYLKSRNIFIALLTIPGIFATHFWYGLRFIQGFFSTGMHDKYGRIE